MSPTIIFTNVDLPAPLGPRKPKTLPLATVSETSEHPTLRP